LQPLAGALSTAISLDKERIPATPRRIICLNLLEEAHPRGRPPSRRTSALLALADLSNAFV
jgi:hypothetical protein